MCGNLHNLLSLCPRSSSHPARRRFSHLHTPKCHRGPALLPTFNHMTSRNTETRLRRRTLRPSTDRSPFPNHSTLKTHWTSSIRRQASRKRRLSVVIRRRIGHKLGHRRHPSQSRSRGMGTFTRSTRRKTGVQLSSPRLHHCHLPDLPSFKITGKMTTWLICQCPMLTLLKLRQSSSLLPCWSRWQPHRGRIRCCSLLH